MTNLIKIRVNYGGLFYSNKVNVICFRKGNIHTYVDVDTDLLSKVVLENMFKEDIGLSEIREMWFLYPGKTIHKGLRLLDNDSAVLECANCLGKNSLMHIYVVQGNEVSPNQLRKTSTPSHLSQPISQPISQPMSQPMSLSIVTYSPLFEYTTENPTQTNTLEDEHTPLEELHTLSSDDDSGPEVRKEDDPEGDPEGGSDNYVVESEFSSSGSEFGFVESEDEDDDLFAGNVDEQVDDVVGGINLKVGDGEEIEDPIDEQYNSDDLKSLSDSDGVSRRYPHFNALVDFKKRNTVQD